MNAYKELKDKIQKTIDDFPMAFAFSDKQFDEGMAKLGLNPDETDKVVSIGCGGFIRKADVEAFEAMWDMRANAIKEAIAADETGDGFIYDMWYYELSNHEYVITMSIEDARRALGISLKEIEDDPRHRRAIERATKEQLDWYYNQE